MNREVSGLHRQQRMEIQIQTNRDRDRGGSEDSSIGNKTLMLSGLSEAGGGGKKSSRPSESIYEAVK